ncbi:MAG: hypothetical protein NTU62_03170 [Spirochaetes bacterium]|nr:hypothetical protein [Spirochaetota bacterium]
MDAAGTRGLYTSTAIGADGTITIAYYELGAADLKLAWSEGAGAAWKLNVIDASAPVVGQYASIAVNDTRIYAAYCHVTNADLRFAWAPNPISTFTNSKIDRPGDVGKYCSLRYDTPSNTIWLAYQDVTNGGLKLARSTLNKATWEQAGYGGRRRRDGPACLPRGVGGVRAEPRHRVLRGLGVPAQGCPFDGHGCYLDDGDRGRGRDGLDPALIGGPGDTLRD